MFAHLLGIVEKSQVVLGFLFQALAPLGIFLFDHLAEFCKKDFSFLSIRADSKFGKEGSYFAVGFCRKLCLEVPLKVQQAELVLGIGEELFYDFGESPEIVGHEKERPFKSPVDEILKDLDPEGF